MSDTVVEVPFHADEIWFPISGAIDFPSRLARLDLPPESRVCFNIKGTLSTDGKTHYLEKAAAYFFIDGTPWLDVYDLSDEEFGEILSQIEGGWETVYKELITWPLIADAITDAERDAGHESKYGNPDDRRNAAKEF